MKNIKTDWFKEAIIYQIYPFSFMDSNNDGWGDIKGIISKLDYVKDLGCNAIWFSPLYESPDYDYGYDIKDYMNIDPKFGSMDDFKELIKECHNREIRVIMDFAGNHTSIEHPWFQDVIKNKDSKYKDYYIIRKGRRKGKKIVEPNNWNSTFTGSAWAKLPGSEDEYYLHLFTKEQPDLNWDNEDVRNYFVDVFNFYMSIGVDGFRLDVFNVSSKVEGLPNDPCKIGFTKGQKYYVDGPHIHEYWKEMNEKAFSKYDSMTVGESFSPSEIDSYNYVKRDNHELDTIFYFAHQQSDCILTTCLPKKFNIMQFKKGVTYPQNKYFNDAWNTLVLENHDTPRIVSRYSFKTKKYRKTIAKMLPIMMYFQWGIPYIYQGQEIGMKNVDWENLNEMKDPVSHNIYHMMRKIGICDEGAKRRVFHGARDNARVPMPWDDSKNAGFSLHTPWQCNGKDYEEINVKKDLESPDSIYKFYQKVLTLKKENKTLIYGTFKEYSHSNKKVYAYLRTYQNENIFVVTNFTHKEIEYKLPDDLKNYNFEPLISNYNEIYLVNKKLTLSPYQSIALIYHTEE